MAEQIQKDSTPIVETNAQGLTITSFTQYQNKLPLRAIAYLQRDIRDAITQQTNDKTHTPVFTAEENASGYRIVRIPLSKLEPRQGHRQRAKLAISQMPGKPVFIPRRKGKKVVDYVGFHNFFLVEFECKKHQTIVVLRVPVVVLAPYLSIGLGYHYLDMQQLDCFTHNCTRQMYRAYKSYFMLGKNSFSPIKLAMTLSSKTKFKNLSVITKEVFMVAKKEMDILYQNGLCDIHFDFRLSQTKNQATGKVEEKVLCTFYTRKDDVLDSDHKAELGAYQAQTQVALEHIFGVNNKTAIDLCQQIKIWMKAELDEMISHKTWFANEMEKKKDDHFNKAGYIVNAMKKFFRKMNQQKNLSEGKAGDGKGMADDSEGKAGDDKGTTTPLAPNGQFFF